MMIRWTSLLLFAAMTGWGCGDSSTPGSDGGGSTGDSIAGTPLEQCKAKSSQFSFKCATLNSFEYMVAGSKFRCLGTKAFSKPLVRFLYKLKEVQNGVPQVRVLRISKDRVPPRTEMQLDFIAPSPAPLSTLPSSVTWPAAIRPMAFAGGLTFIDAQIDQVRFSFSTLDKKKLVLGSPVRGTFTLKGGTFTVLDKQGKRQTVTDPTAEGVGCFNLYGRLAAY